MMNEIGWRERNIAVFKWFNFFSRFSPYSVISVIYFSQVAGSYALGLSVLSISMVASAVFEIPTGVFSDYLGRKNTMVLGSFFSMLGLVFYALGGSFPVLVIGSLFDGLAESFFSGNNDALVYESLDNPEHQYAEVSGRLRSLSKIGAASSALLGGALAFKSFSLVVWFSLVPYVITFFITFAVVEPRIHSRVMDANIFSHLREAIKSFFHNHKLRVLSMVSILRFGIEETLYQFSTAFVAVLWPIWAVGVVRAMDNIFVATSFWFAGRLIKKFTAVKTFIFGNLSDRFFAIVATAVPTAFSPVLLTFAGMFYGATSVAQMSLLQGEFTEHQRATMGSLNSLLGSLFFAVFAFVSGAIADSIGLARALLIGHILLLAIVAFFYTSFVEQGTKDNSAVA